MILSVIYLEWLRACTRGKLHRLRHAYFWLLAFEMLIFVILFSRRGLFDMPRGALQIGYGFLQILCWQHWFIVSALPPAFAAGSIADEKTRGTLMLLLATPLTPLEIIVAKWIALTGQVLILALPAAPAMVLAAFLSGVPTAWLLSGAVITLVVAGTTTASGLLASALLRRTASAVFACYVTAAILGVGLYFLAENRGWSAGFDYEQALVGAVPVSVFLPLVVVCLSLSAGILLLAAGRLRPAYERHLSAAPSPASRWRWLRRPAVSDLQPLRWKERYTGELGILAFLRAIPQHQRKLAAFLLSGVASLVTVQISEVFFLAQSVIFVLIVALSVAVRASSVICGERERQTWEAILSTPLRPYDIIRQKLWGIIDSAKPYLMGYLIPALVAACFVSVHAIVWTISWWTAAWASIYFMGAVGIRSSTQASGSWQSLLKTLTSAGLRMLQSWFFFMLPFGFCVNLIAFSFAGPGVGTRTSLGFLILGYAVFAFFFLGIFVSAEQALQEAEKRIDEERIPDDLIAALRKEKGGPPPSAWPRPVIRTVHR